MHRLDPVCARFNEHLKAAMAAVYALSERKVQPRQIRLDDNRPVVVIDPPRDAWIQGAMRRRECTALTRRHVMVAPFQGVLLEWEVNEARNPPSAQSA